MKVLALAGLLALALGTYAKPPEVPSCYRLEDPKREYTWREGPDGNDYVYYAEKATAGDAQAICRKIGGHLVMEKTAATRDFIVKTWKGNFWIGVKRDPKNTKKFRWIDGTSIAKAYWFTANGEPNNKGGNENCVIHLGNFGNLWNDVDCKLKFEFLCQKKTQFNCEKCAAKATMINMAMPGGHVPTCWSDGSFSAKQCSAKFCWCVWLNGVKIAGSMRSVKFPPPNCMMMRRSSYVYKKPTLCRKKAGAKKGFKPKCDANGDFAPEQCLSNSFCWCSLSGGGVIPETVHHKADKNKPDCLKHRDLTYDCKKKVGTYPHPFDPRRFMYCFMKSVYSCHCPGDTMYPNRPNAVCRTP